MSRKDEIIPRSVEIIKSNPNGIRYSELVKQLHKELPHIPLNTIHGNIWDLAITVPDKITKPARGLWKYKFGDEVNTVEVPRVPEKKIIKEDNFYQPFSDWLVNDLEDCTKAIPLGGNRFKDKWGTPDVIGKRVPAPSDILKGETEIVSAEIKIDTKELITAFGQACAYKLFSHKSYIVVPRNSPQDDISKLDALCQIFGIGLVLFDNFSISEPAFEIRVRSIKHEPDMWYVNKFMKEIESELFQ